MGNGRVGALLGARGLMRESAGHHQVARMGLLRIVVRMPRDKPSDSLVIRDLVVRNPGDMGIRNDFASKLVRAGLDKKCVGLG